MKVKINEVFVNEDIKDIYSLREKYKKEADLIILNGFPIKENKEVKDMDRLVFIKKGELYSKDELENLMMARHTPGIHEKLKKARVTICGAGGLGSNIAISLARIGVGKIKIIDFDIVEPSNLNRQQYFIEDIGKYKVVALRKTLERINPFIEVDDLIEKIDKHNIDELLKEENLVVEAFDNPENKAMLTNFILKQKNIKLICSSGMAGYYSANKIKTKRLMENVYLCGDFEKEAKDGDGLMAPRVSICANHMANMVLRIILGEDKE